MNLLWELSISPICTRVVFVLSRSKGWLRVRNACIQSKIVLDPLILTVTFLLAVTAVTRYILVILPDQFYAHHIVEWTVAERVI